MKNRKTLVVTLMMLILFVVCIIDPYWKYADYRSCAQYVPMNPIDDTIVDAVIIWVDSSDPQWLAQKALYTKTTNDEVRLPNSGNCAFEVKYTVQLMLQNLPFLRHLHFVTQRPQQVPRTLMKLLPTKLAQKIKLVHHDEFIPATYLPLFNSSAIELFIHRIPGLSDQFIYFNDDMYILKPLTKNAFFGYKNHKVVPLHTCLVPYPLHYFRNFVLTSLNTVTSSTHALAFLAVTPKYKDLPWYIKLYRRDHRPIALTKTTLSRTFNDLHGKRLIDKFARYRFRSKHDILFIVLSANQALYHGTAVRPKNLDLSLIEIFGKLTAKKIQTIPNFLNVNSLDAANENECKALATILDPIISHIM